MRREYLDKLVDAIENANAIKEEFGAGTKDDTILFYNLRDGEWYDGHPYYGLLDIAEELGLKVTVNDRGEDAVKEGLLRYSYSFMYRNLEIRAYDVKNAFEEKGGAE